MPEALKLAFFVAMKEGGSYLGGLLVTDMAGIPLDFRYTEPITPTRLQSVLYGKALEPYLKEEIIQKTLLKELKVTPDLLLVPPLDLAGGWAGDKRFAVASVQKTQEPPLPKLGEQLRVSPREILLQVGEGTAPLRILFPASQEMGQQEGTVARLLEAGYHMDLVEPLERVHAALQTLLKPD